TANGKYLVATGFPGPPGQPRHLLNGYMASTGERLWSVPVNAPPNRFWVGLDPTSSMVSFDLGKRPWTFLEIAGGKYLGTTDIDPLSLGPLAKLGASPSRRSPEDPLGLAFWQRDNGRERLLFRLLHDSSFQPGSIRIFTRDGRFAAVGSADGSVFVFDFET